MTSLLDKVFGCLVGGLIGDAMGTPTEGREPEFIETTFGWVDDFEGDGTDDSILKHLLCDALLATGGYATADDWAAAWLRNRSQIFGPKRGKFMISVLHTANKLEQGYAPRVAAFGNMASSSSAMSIAPIGVVNAANPQAASAQAQEIAGLIHVGDVGFCQDAAAAIAAAVAAALAPDASVEAALAAATAYLKPTSGREMRLLIERALRLAQDVGDYRAFREAYHKTFRQRRPSDSRETVPAALALCRLAHGDVALSITYGANFGRDTDTIATMAGAICGALGGRETIPPAWVTKVEASAARDQHALAAALAEVAVAKATREIARWSLLTDRSSLGP